MNQSIIVGLSSLICGVLLKYMSFKRNYFLGYRTCRSLKNDDNWKFAQKEGGKYLIITGLFSISATLAFWYIGLNTNYLMYSTIGLIVISAVLVEIRLKKFEKSVKR